MGLCQCAKENVDRDMPPSRPGFFGQFQAAVGHAQHAVWRDHIDVLRLDLHGFVDLSHRHRGGALQCVRNAAWLDAKKKKASKKLQPMRTLQQSIQLAAPATAEPQQAMPRYSGSLGGNIVASSANGRFSSQ